MSRKKRVIKDNAPILSYPLLTDLPVSMRKHVVAVESNRLSVVVQRVNKVKPAYKQK